MTTGWTSAVQMLPGERWWGGANFFGTKMPFTEKTSVKIDLRHDNYHNQCASFLVSDKGRAVWCDRQCLIEIEGGSMRITPDVADAKVSVSAAGATLRDAFRFASRTWCPPSGQLPDLLFFSAPQ